jgi:hypothetical protein
MDWSKIDWAALERMRGGFLEGAAGREDYWRSESDLEAYDQSFAQRIGWKWDFVLADLARLGWRPPQGDVLDWGCGSGVAGRRFLTRFHTHTTGSLVLHDRSMRAMDYAERRAREEFPGLAVRRETASGTPAPMTRQTPLPPGEVPPLGGGEGDSVGEGSSRGIATTILVSHVLSELSGPSLDSLLAQVRRATAVLWVEPGTYQASRALIAVRERLRGEFQIVAPCTHQAICGLVVPENERHWCHHFGATPTEVFMDGDWARFARLAGIDLRSLPLSYLVLDKRPVRPLPAGAVRVIGRPRIRKDCALLFGCDASGVRDRRLAKRTFPQEYKLCKREEWDTLHAWRLEGDNIVGLAEVPSAE